MSLTQNHIQFLRTSGNTAPSTSNLLEGELAVNVNASSPKIYLRTKTGIAEFGNTGKDIILGEDIIHISQVIAESSLTINEAIAKFYTALAETEEINAGAINNLKEEIDAIPTITGVTYTGVTGSPVSQISLLDKELIVGRRPDMYVNTALTLSGFTVVNGDDIQSDEVTIPPGKAGIVYNVGNQVRYRFRDVITKVIDNTASAPTGKAVGSIRVSTNIDGEETYTYTYVDYINSAATATNATMIGGNYIETVTRSEWETPTFSPQDNHVYLIYG